MCCSGGELFLYLLVITLRYTSETKEVFLGQLKKPFGVLCWKRVLFSSSVRSVGWVGWVIFFINITNGGYLDESDSTGC